MSKLKIKLVKSTIGATVPQKRVVKALGLHKLNSEVIQEDNPAIRGMIQAIPHLLTFEPVDEK